MRRRIDNSIVAPEKIRLPFMILVCLQASLYCMLRLEFATPTVVECHGLAKETLRQRLKQLLAFLGSLGFCRLKFNMGVMQCSSQHAYSKSPLCVCVGFASAQLEQPNHTLPPCILVGG